MRLGALAFLWLALVGGPAAATGSGLYGTVMRGPVAPVCTTEQPCSVPAGGATLVFLRNGREVARAKTSATGSYRIVLAPGVYAVRAGKRPLDPDTVRVRRARMLRVDFSIDTGIRYPAAVEASGLRGVVKEGPASPVCVAGPRATASREA